MSTVAFAKRQSRVIHGPSLSPERAPSLRAGYFGDLHVYDPAAMAWTDLSAAASGTPPSARENQGFASTGGRIYVYGGKGEIGEIWVRQEYERKLSIGIREKKRAAVVRDGSYL